MSIKLQCPGCRSKLVIREDNAGRQHRCPKCQQLVSSPQNQSVTDNASPTTSVPPEARRNRIFSRLKTSFKWVLISLTVCIVMIPMLFLVLLGLASLMNGRRENPQVSSQGSDSATTVIPIASDPAHSTPSVDMAALEAAARRQEAATRNQDAWRQLDLCNNNYDRLSRDAPLEYWEAMRQGYGEIDVRNVDWEFAAMIEDYRSLFLDYANTHRQWTQERQPLVDALNGVEVPESFAEGLVTGFAGGVAIGMIDDIDTRYRNRLTGLQPRMEELNQKAGTLRNEMAERHGVSM